MAHRIPHPLPVAALSVMIGIALAVITAGSWNESRALGERGREATGRVVQVRERAWPKAPRVRVEFVTADGRTVRAWIGGDRDSAPRVGREVRVSYDPRDPEGNVSDARHTGDGFPWLLVAVSAVFLFGAPAFAWFVIRPARRAIARRAL